MFENIKTNLLQSEKITVILGQRNVGKHLIIEELIQYLRAEKNVPSRFIYRYNLDDILVQLNLKDSFQNFKSEIEASIGEKLSELKEPIYLFFEQIQNFTSLFSVVAELKRINPQHIKIVLSSSIDLQSNKDFKKQFYSIAKFHYVYPQGLNALIDNNFVSLQEASVLHTICTGSFDVDHLHHLFSEVTPHKEAISNFIEEYLLFGGLPGVHEHQSAEHRWEVIRNYLRTYFERDLLPVYQITDLKKFNDIINILSLSNGKVLNLLNMCDDYGINRNTMRKYTGIMRDTFLIDFVQPYLKDVNKPIIKTPKFYFLNTGLVNYLSGNLNFQSLRNNKNFNSLLDAMLYLNLRSTLVKYECPAEILFLKDYQDHELDFLISTEHQLIPVGVTFNNVDRKMKIKTFKYYLRYCPQIFNGVIFGNFNEIEVLEMRKSKLFLLPIWMLW